MVRPAGHPELRVRGILALLHGAWSCVLLLLHVNLMHQPLLIWIALCASVAFFYQWLTADPRMLLVRSVCYAVHGMLSVHVMVCGRRWGFLSSAILFGESSHGCAIEGLQDMRLPFRIIHILLAVQSFSLSQTLVSQFHHPHKGATREHGCSQLRYRSRCNCVGIPLHMVAGVMKIVWLGGSPWQSIVLQIVTRSVRCFLIWCASESLYRQWKTSGLPAAASEEEDEEGMCTVRKRTASSSTEPPWGGCAFVGSFSSDSSDDINEDEGDYGDYGNDDFSNENDDWGDDDSSPEAVKYVPLKDDGMA